MCLLEIEELVMEIILLFSVFAMLVFLTLNQKLYLPEFIIRYVHYSSRYGDYKNKSQFVRLRKVIVILFMWEYRNIILQFKDIPVFLNTVVSRWSSRSVNAEVSHA